MKDILNPDGINVYPINFDPVGVNPEAMPIQLTPEIDSVTTNSFPKEIILIGAVILLIFLFDKK